MGIIRSYFSKNTSLIRDNSTNNSRNPVFELSYGGSITPSSTTISRYVFTVDLSTLTDKINNNQLFQSNGLTHKIRIKNVINESQDLIGGVFIDALRGSNSNVLIYPLKENFVEGNGFDFIYTPLSYDPNVLNQTPANWFYSDTSIYWNELGSFSGATPDTVLDTQYIQDGSEDICLDVTDYINGVLFSGVTNYGLGIAYSSDTESYASLNRYVITFFSKYTQTFYEPFLETSYQQSIVENRNTFKLDENNNLYLISNKNLTSVDKIEIYDNDGNIYTTIMPPYINLIKKNIWGIVLSVSSLNYPDLVNFTDKWFYTVNGIQSSYEQTFTLYNDNYFDGGSSFSSKYYFSFYGITYNEKISMSSGCRKIYLQGRRIHKNNVDADMDFDYIEYRLYNQQSDTIQIEIIPWTAVNRTHEGFYFELDPSWLVPQFYFIELRVIKNNFHLETDSVIKFNIVSEA